MLPPFHRLLFLLLCGVAGTVAVPVPAGATSSADGNDQVSAQPAWRVSFPSALGHAYQLEGQSSENGPWLACSEIAFGTGALMQLQGIKADLADITTFRVVEVNPNLVGQAPGQLALGKTLSLAEETGSAQLILHTATTGVYRLAGGEPLKMTWTYFKTAPNQGRFTANLENGLTSVTEINFSSAAGGRFLRQFWSPAQVLLDSAGGVFALSDRQVWATATEGHMPTNLVGKTLTVQTNGEPVTYTFGETTVSRKIGAGIGQELPYAYEPESGHQGMIQLMDDGIPCEEIKFTAETPTTGSVVRTKYDGATALPSETGSFSNPSAAPATTTANCDAPNSLVDESFDMSDSISGSVTLDFGANGEGTHTTRDGGSIQQTPFTYSYTRLGERKGRIVTVLPTLDGTEIDEILLTFTGENDCAGTFERKHYRNGVLISSSNGTFGPGHPPPAG